jgi:Asp-tRNA(Asn)/Glu-tRNA(Gln) amidotransferase A subunit family amidase
LIGATASPFNFESTLACPLQMTSIPSNFLTATETIALVRAGKLTVTQVAQDHLARYNERDASQHAWAFLDPDRVLSEAKRLDAIPVEQRGPLHGAILGVKDMISELHLLCGP